MAQGDANKWNLPGWKIEYKYSPQVLVGNWQENRLKSMKDASVRATSSHRIEFRDPGPHQPDVILRRKAALRTEGIGKDHIFNHHGNRYSHNLISLYDENYNRRDVEESKLPTLRKWDQHSLSWQPEKSDHPLQGSSTRFGLAGSACGSSMSNNTARGTELSGGQERDFYTTYSSSYWPVSPSARAQLRYATGRELSSHLHRQNSINKNMHLRGSQNFQAPEILGPVAARPMHPDKYSSLA